MKTLMVLIAVMVLMVGVATAGDNFSTFGEPQPNIYNPAYRYAPDNPLADWNRWNPDNIYNPANRFAPSNPLNPANRWQPENNFNPANKWNPYNPLNPANRFNPYLPSKP